MAWTALGFDENTGMVRWNAGPGQDQYLQPGQDPNAGVQANAFGWNPNAVMPEGGWSAGALLQPNYAPTLDMTNQAAVAAALKDVAPGYTPTTGADGSINLNAQVPVSQQRAPAKDPGIESLLGAGALAGLGYLSGGFGLGDLFSSFGGSPANGGGMDWWGTDYMGDYGFPDVNVNTMMPAAVAETPAQLTEWGLRETAPGVWEMPAMPDIKMGASDWLKLGGQAAGKLFGGSTPNVNTTGGLGSLFSGTGGLGSIFGSTGGLLGAGLGGLAGMLNGTKKIDDAVTTESGYNSTLSPAAEAEMLKTIRGDYLNPDSNPWLKSTFDRAAGEIQSKLSPSFGHMEAFGQNSGFQNAFGRSLADLGTSLYGGNYNNERTRQYGAASAAPNYVKKSTTPVYSNPLGGMFSGALAGGLLGGKLFGG